MPMRKALLGQKIRHLRQERKLTQTQAAAQLGISASYLNLIEHDERPVTVALLLKISQAFDIDIQRLSDDSERRLSANLREAFAEKVLNADDLDDAEIDRLVSASPKAARAVVALYRAWRAARDDAQAFSINLPSGRKQRIVLPTEEVRDFFETHANHFPTIETAAEDLWRIARLEPHDLSRGLASRLKDGHGIAVSIRSSDKLEGALRRFDPAQRSLELSEALSAPSRAFHLAYQIGLLEARDHIGELIAAAKLASPQSESLCRIGLANYFAGAVMIPYQPYVEAAREVRYDIDLLMARFGVTFEQAAHRLSTLRQRDGAVPFFFARTDIAGNLSKRFSGAGFHLPQFGGACPRWVLHEAFSTPGQIRTQTVRLPDGRVFFCFARTVEKPSEGFSAPISRFSIVLGCEISRAHEIVYASGLDLKRLEDPDGDAVEIGPGCRLCVRANCRQRAFAPLEHRLVIDETLKSGSAYTFNVGDRKPPS